MNKFTIIGQVDEYVSVRWVEAENVEEAVKRELEEEGRDVESDDYQPPLDEIYSCFPGHIQDEIGFGSGEPIRCLADIQRR